MASPGLCARFHKAVELIGRRWSGAIIQILRQRPSRYAELRTAIPDITDRMLSERLRELEDEAIVARTVIPETPVRVEYSLTAKGRALAPALDAIGHWAERWVETSAASTAAAAAPPVGKARRKPVTATASRRGEGARLRQ
jgi:DNA-binding HxlR family transcriptional regulator